MHKSFAGFLILLAVAGLASAQSTAPNAVSGESAPVTLGGSGQMTNVIHTQFSAQGMYNSSSYIANGGGDWVTYLQSNFSFLQDRKRMRWNLEYDPGVVLDQSGQTGSMLNQNFGTDMTFKVARHTDIRLHDNFSIDSSILRNAPLDTVSEFGLLSRPDDSLLAPYSRRTYEQVGLQATQMLSARSEFSVSGSFDEVNFDERSGTVGSPQQQLIDTRAVDGEASYSYRLSRRHTIGLMYQHQDYWVQGIDSGGQSQGFFYTHSVTFAKGMTLSGFIGPQYTRNHNQVFVEIDNGSVVDRHFVQSQFGGWSVSGGSTFQVQRKKTGLALSAVRRVNDGDGLSGAGHYNDFSGRVSRQVFRKWTVDVNADYSNSQLLGTASPVSFAAVSGGASLQRSFRHGLSAQASYLRIHQLDLVGQPILGNLDHNQISLSLNYEFSHGLGR